MSRGGAARKTAPVGWVHVGDGYTVRWRRGDPVAYVLDGERTGDHGMAGVVATIPVSPTGWTDLAEVRQVGQQWRRQHRNRTSARPAAG